MDKHSKKNINFYERETIPKLVIASIKILRKNKDKIRVLDLGCGDGNLVNQLFISKLVNKEDLVVGLDPSMIRLKRGLKGNFICGGDNLPFKKNSFDLVTSMQVIEHVKSDSEFIKEIYRILKKNGLFFISSIFKKRYAFYIYRRNNKFVIDPTHIREYKSEEDFLKVLKDFKVIEIDSKMFKFPLTDLIIRGLLKLNLANPESMSKIYLRNNMIYNLRKLINIPIFGYYYVEVLCKK